MKIRKVINKPLRNNDGIAAAINAVVSANVNEPKGSVTRASSRQKIVQRNGETVVFEQTHEDQKEKGETNGWE